MVAVDVTVYNEWSPTWSLCYDRENLAKAADYLVIMGYDETPGNSTVPGSVASYSWLDDSIKVLKRAYRAKNDSGASALYKSLG